VDHVEYNSFGKRLDTPAIDAAFGWTGRYRDAHTGLQYNNARWYDPTVGRWLSEDPIGFGASDANLLRYVDNAPTLYIDPSGMARAKRLWNGIEVLLDKDTAEFVLDNGKQIKVRNAKFIDCDVSLDDLAKLSDVSPNTIATLRQRYGSDLSIKFDKFGQPDFSRFRKAPPVKIPNPGASNYREKAWEVLKTKHPSLYKKLWPDQENYVWHHRTDGCLELLDKDLHSAFQHTGLQSVLKQLGGAALGLLPGAAASRDGRINDAAREVALEATPIGWGSFITDYFSWLFDSAWEDIYGDKPQASVERR
jgi:RHS repeat-associated protein